MNTTKYTCGALMSIPDLRDHVATVVDPTPLPEKFTLVMPRVKNQGSVGSCVAHAISTVAEYFSKKETSKNLKLSTGYIYGNRLLTLHKGTGMCTRDALKTMTKFGVVPYEEFPDNVEVPYAITRFEEEYPRLESIGLNYKFKSYFRLNDVNSIKQYIYEGSPAILTIYWYDDIQIKDGVLTSRCVKTKNTGGHCMTIYGWNQTGWLVQNSWGTSWGNRGRFVLPYSVPVKEVWGVQDEVSDSSLVIRKPFSSKLGAFVARIIHKIISFFYNLKNSKR